MAEITESVSRAATARRFRLPEATLRAWESCGLMPRFHEVDQRLYADRMLLILSGRKALSMQRVRQALAIGGC